MPAYVWAVPVGWRHKAQRENTHLILYKPVLEKLDLLMQFVVHFHFLVFVQAICSSSLYWSKQFGKKIKKNPRAAFDRGKQQVTTLFSLNPLSGLPGPNMLRPWGVCPRRVPLLCGLGRARM